MPRHRGRPRLPSDDRDRRLAEEVLYLHDLWRRGPPAPAPVSSPAPTQSRSARREATKRKRRKLERAAEPQDTGSEWALAPSPPTSPKTWPEAAPASSPAKSPPPPPSPGSLAQREALRAAAEFFSRRGSSSSSEDDEGSESEGEEEEAARFFTGLFERDAALRGHYERGWEERQFACMACAAGRRKAGRRFRGCVALVQHAHAASTRYGRPLAHRALAAVICRVFGWDIERLPSIVVDPRGTLGQALAAEAKDKGVSRSNGSSNDEDEEKEDAETGMEDSTTDGDEEVNELESGKEPAQKEDVETGMEDAKSIDGDQEAKEPENGEESAEKEDLEEIGPPNTEEISRNEVLCNETDQEVNGNRDDSLSQDNSGEVFEQRIAKESSEQENANDTFLPSSKDICKNEEHCEKAAVQEELNAAESEKEYAKTSDDTGDIAATRLGNNSSMEENVGENKDEHCYLIT